jgi:hypothetical protein
MAGPGNQHNLKHGGEGAIRRISQGQPFLGIALDQEQAVTKRLEAEGLEALVQENAIRLQTATDLYYQAVLKAAQDGDTAAFDRFIARYGWIASVTLRAWAQVKQDRKGKGGHLSEVLDSYAKVRTQEGTGSTVRGAPTESGTNTARKVPPKDFDSYDAPPREEE